MLVEQRQRIRLPASALGITRRTHARGARDFVRMGGMRSARRQRRPRSADKPRTQIDLFTNVIVLPSLWTSGADLRAPSTHELDLEPRRQPVTLFPVQKILRLADIRLDELPQAVDVVIELVVVRLGAVGLVPHGLDDFRLGQARARRRRRACRARRRAPRGCGGARTASLKEICPLSRVLMTPWRESISTSTASCSRRERSVSISLRSRPKAPPLLVALSSRSRYQ